MINGLTHSTNVKLLFINRVTDKQMQILQFILSSQIGTDYCLVSSEFQDKTFLIVGLDSLLTFLSKLSSLGLGHLLVNGKATILF